MRVQLSRQVISQIYALRDDSTAIRAALELVRHNPDHPDAIMAPGRTGRRELFVRVGLRGYWIIYEVDRTGSETVIIVVSVEDT